MELYRKLEFDIILNKVCELAASQVVKDEILNTSPTNDIAIAKKLLTQTGDAIAVLASHRPDLDFDDIGQLVHKAHAGGVLSPAELLKVRNSICCLRSLKKCVENMDACDSLKDITAWVKTCDELEREIDLCVENETDLKDSASEKLYSLRRAISRANAKLKEKLESFTRQSDISRFLQDNIVTIRGGRYVIPVRSECRSSVKGLIHDVSSSGSTVFVEPFSIVEANNELRTLKTEEQAEVERILFELSRTVDNNSYDLSEGQRVLIECGVIFAKAEYAKKTDAYPPVLNEAGKINVKSARHPLIARDTVVPVDIELNKRILLISGPNTGGKTVVLKTVGLFALFAACGMFLPSSEGCEMSIFNDIYCDIGDSQSIVQSLSTFSAHVKNLAEITSKADSRSLVLLDEVGDGTDPDEGSALAIAILKSLQKSSATAVVTTHFNAVKEFAIGSDDVSNACMQFDLESFKPTFKLILGASGSSYALEIAENLGLDAQIISYARNALSDEKVVFDRILRETEKLRNDALRYSREAEELKNAAKSDAERSQKIREDLEKRLAEINEKSRALVRKEANDYIAVAEDLISEIKEKVKQADQNALFEARKIAKKLSDNVPSDTKKPKKSENPADKNSLVDGTRVYVSGLDKEGVVVGNPRGNKAVVAIGSIKTELPISSLSVMQEKKSKQNKAVREVAEPVNTELMLLGFTVDDATAELDRVLSDIPPRSTIRVVHGKGTGALGKGIQAYLKRQPRVKSFRYGRYGEGDTGVTIVEIK